LFVLVVLGWASERSGWAWLAGGSIALAASLKLSPALFLIWFLVRRRWAALTWGLGIFTTLHLLALAVLGPEAFREYLTIVLPSLGKYRGEWQNLSIGGFWNRLFDPGDYLENVVPLVRLPIVARIGTAGTALALFTWFALRARWASDATDLSATAETDRAFLVGIATMMLISPLTWPTDCVLLAAIPFFVLNWLSVEMGQLSWKRLLFYPGGRAVIPLAVLLFVLSLDPPILYKLFLSAEQIFKKEDGTVTPATWWESVTVISLPTYALLALLVTLDRWPLGRRAY
jgi:hypothetical protein